MNKTKIEWAKNPDGSQGYTWNPITGCLNGCEYCYARRLANTRLREWYLANVNYARPIISEGYETLLELYQDPFYPRFWPERLKDLPVLKTYQGRFSSEVKNALLAKQCKGVFVCDMSDLFGIGVPEEWTRAVLDQCNKFWHHRFYLLTKQPQNLIKWSPFPENCWVGITATDNDMAFMAIGYLRLIKAKVKYISFEPLLAPIIRWIGDAQYLFKYLDWVVIGAQTKPYRPPKIEWVQEIVEAADKAGIPVFLKNNLKPLLQQNTHNIYSFPEWAGTQFAMTGGYSLAPVYSHPNEAMRKLRQEFPKA